LPCSYSSPPGSKRHSRMAPSHSSLQNVPPAPAL
jgi:hypothetical protein